MRGFSSVLLIFIVLLMGLGVVSYFFYKQQPISDIQQINPSPMISESPSVSPVKNEQMVDDGKSYTSKGHLYTFNYPENTQKDLKVGCGGPKISRGNSQIIVCDYGYGASSGAAELAKMFSQGRKVISSNEATVSGVIGTKLVVDADGKEATYLLFDYDKAKNGQPVTVSIYFSGDDKELLDEVIKSFQFIR